MVENFIKYALHPLILTCVLTGWLFNLESPAFYLLVLLCVHSLLGALEYWQPARPEWVVPAWPKLINIVLVVILVMGAGMVAELYQVHLVTPPYSSS